MHFFMFRWILFKWIPRGFEKKRKSINCKSGSRQLCSELPLHFRSNDVQQSLAVPLPLPQGSYSFWVLTGTAKDCCTSIRPRGWEFTCRRTKEKSSRSHCGSSITVMTIERQEREIATFSGWTFDLWFCGNTIP